MPLHNLSIKIRNKKYKISKFDPNKKLRLNLRWLIYVHIKKKDNNNVEKKLFLQIIPLKKILFDRGNIKF